MAEYNLSEFRANTRKAFDEAERGEPVYIERYGEDFILMSKKNWGETFVGADMGSPDGDSSVEVVKHPDGRITVTKAEYTPPAKKNNSDPQADELPGVDTL